MFHLHLRGFSCPRQSVRTESIDVKVSVQIVSEENIGEDRMSLEVSNRVQEQIFLR